MFEDLGEWDRLDRTIKLYEDSDLSSDEFIQEVLEVVENIWRNVQDSSLIFGNERFNSELHSEFYDSAIAQIDVRLADRPGLAWRTAAALRFHSDFEAMRYWRAGRFMETCRGLRDYEPAARDRELLYLVREAAELGEDRLAEDAILGFRKVLDGDFFRSLLPLEDPRSLVGDRHAWATALRALVDLAHDGDEVARAHVAALRDVGDERLCNHIATLERRKAGGS